MRALLELREFSVSHGAVEAVHQVDLTVDAGEIVTVIGPNGAGKTTLLSAAMGLLPSRGQLHLGGTAIARPNVEAMVAQGVAARRPQPARAHGRSVRHLSAPARAPRATGGHPVGR
jgi:ABC-type branched-subunit amino acid transport system ATPase component